MAEFIDDKIPKFDVMRACLQSQQLTKRPDLRGLGESPQFKAWLDQQYRAIEVLMRQSRQLSFQDFEARYFSVPEPPDQRPVDGVRETYFYLDQVHALKRVSIPNRYFAALDLAASVDDK